MLRHSLLREALIELPSSLTGLCYWSVVPAAQNQQCCNVMCEFKVHLLSVVENRGCSPSEAALEQ